MNTELFKPFNLCFRVIKTLGMWQDGQQTWRYFFLGFLFHFLTIELFLICQVVYIAKGENFEQLIETMALFLVILALSLKSFERIRRIIKTVEVLNQLLEFTCHNSTKRRGNLIRRTREILRFYYFFWSCTTFASICGLLTVIVIHKMPSSMWFPFDTEGSEIGFWIGSFYMIAVSCIGSTLTVAWEVLPVIFISFAVGLVEELGERLQEVKDKDDLVKCIKVHLKIKDYVREIKNIFSLAILIQGIISSTSICFGAFSLSTVSPLSAQNYLLSLTFCTFQETYLTGYATFLFFTFSMILKIFLPCYFGNELTSASSKLSTALYDSAWLETDREFKMNMKIFIENAKLEINFTAFSFFKANLETFKAIVNTAYSLYAVLKNINK